MRQILPDEGLEIVINVLVEQAKVNKEGNTEEGVIENIERLSIVKCSWEGAFSEEIKYDECNYDVFPPKEYEEIRKPIIKPSTMM